MYIMFTIVMILAGSRIYIKSGISVEDLTYIIYTY